VVRIESKLTEHLSAHRAKFSPAYEEQIRNARPDQEFFRQMLRLTLVIYRAPQVVHLSIDLHEHLVEVPSPPAGSHPLDPAFPDPGGEHRAEPVLSVPDRFVTGVDIAFVQ
jgi:hypothetical protein